MTSVDLSVVVPALNEREALPKLLGEIREACNSLAVSWEVIVIDDGSSDGTTELIEQLAVESPEIRCIRFRRKFGKSAALAAGIAHSGGDTLVTIDGDGQDDPADIPALLAKLDRNADLVSGWKRHRRDPFARRLASRVFNSVTSWLTGVSMHDMNCGFKAYRGACARSAQQGWRVAEIPVNHRPRRHGKSRFGTERYLRGALDLLTVVFIGRYQYRPLHLFGGMGFVVTIAGVVISVYLTILKISGEAIGQRPLLFLGILLIVVGVQLLTFGLLAQMVLLVRQDRQGSDLAAARIAQTVGFAAPVSSDADDRPRSTRGTTPAR